MLRFFYSNADERFDMARGFETLNKELHEIHPQLSKKGGSREADVLVKVFLRDGSAEYFVLHLEIQKVVNKHFPKRVYEYNYRLSDYYNMPIVSLAVYTGLKGQPCPNEYASSLLGTELSFKYKTYQIFDHTEDELVGMKSPFALVILTAQQEALANANKVDEDYLDAARTKIMRSLVGSKTLDTDGIRKFLYFMGKLIPIKNATYNRIFEEELRKLTGGKITMGIMETVKMLNFEEGKEEGRYEFIERLIEKFGWSDEQTADLANVSVAYVNEVRKELASSKIEA